MNGWSPNPNDLRTILELLHSSQSADNEVQRQVQERLQQLNQYPDFHYYLGLHNKVGCVFPMIVRELGQDDHREDAPHFNIVSNL